VRRGGGGGYARVKPQKMMKNMDRKAATCPAADEIVPMSSLMNGTKRRYLKRRSHVTTVLKAITFRHCTIAHIGFS
jgi:hypothetical protein